MAKMFIHYMGEMKTILSDFKCLNSKIFFNHGKDVYSAKNSLCKPHAEQLLRPNIFQKTCGGAKHDSILARVESTSST